MRWMWIDKITELVEGEKLVAVKNVSLAEEHLHDHFEGDSDITALPIMPASLIIEGMAQSAGILVGHAGKFKEKVVLAKVGKALLEKEATPGCTLRYTAKMERYDEGGASTNGTVEMRGAGEDAWEAIGVIDLLFSHIDNNMSGLEFPEENFVFHDGFRDILVNSGISTEGFGG